jgi:hypothetical protein
MEGSGRAPAMPARVVHAKMLVKRAHLACSEAENSLKASCTKLHSVGAGREGLCQRSFLIQESVPFRKVPRLCATRIAVAPSETTLDWTGI